MLIVSASDKDSGIFGNITYKIASGNEEGIFGIDPLQGWLKPLSVFTVSALNCICSALGEVYLQKSLRHVGGPVRLTVQATDGVGKAAERPATVAISVVGSNTISPVFGQSLYKLTVREDIFPGIAIGQVTASGTSCNYAILHTLHI